MQEITIHVSDSFMKETQKAAELQGHPIEEYVFYAIAERNDQIRQGKLYTKDPGLKEQKLI